MAGFCIPFVILFGLQFRNPFTRVFIFVAGSGTLMVMIGRAASRAGVLALIAMTTVYFLRGTGSQRVGIAVASFTAIAGMFILLPQTSLERIYTIMDSTDTVNTAQASEAMASTAERRELLQDAINITRSNPIFGVGAGQFLDYRASHLKREDGSNKRYFPAHNTYAQFAAETGIPGLLLYVIFLFMIHKTIRRTRKLALRSNHPNETLIFQIATCLEAALVYFSLFAFFMNCDRHPHQFVVAGLAIALERLLQHWVSQQSAAPASSHQQTSGPRYQRAQVGLPMPLPSAVR
jgi:O-antigen ligase